MQLHDLPDDVLRLVLEASFAPRVNSIAPTLKANLPLLAVCPTSLDLVVAADCVQMVKRVEIVVNYKLNPFPGLSAVIRLMRAAAEEWRGFDGELAAIYSDQLESLHSYHPITIVFLNLKELTVIYWPTDVVDGVEARYPDGHPWKLHFPKLSKLHVSCKLDVCPLLEVSIMRSSNSNPAALAAANRILESAQEGKERFLKVYDESIPVLPESITCTLLTALSIDADTSVDTALGLIRILPNLGSLYIWRLTLHDIQEDISVPGPDEDCRVEPFNARVKEMRPIAEFVSAYSNRQVYVSRHG
ncbi:hypothetical protein H4R18_004125 [Coemansia javaensis]|uniref:Uncharacterized protein n=1 Tax=Coemansia javaensis TaxID=2761396 RepID=A0A9W8LG96_9FUNG|nr:hypothetical protein H4R18_004125 [Coemansia javaensis]